MEDAFSKLQNDHKNNADNLIKWMKESKVVENKEAEDKARAMFGNAEEQKNVDISKFKEVVGKLAQDQKKNVEEVTAKLAEKGPEMLKNAMASAAAAFKDMMK